MHSIFQTIFNFVQDARFAAVFLDALLKSVVVLALAGGLCLVWRRASAATRHLIWLLSVASLPFLPLLSSVLPSWQRPLWSVSTNLNSGNQVSYALEFAPAIKPQTSSPETQLPQTNKPNPGAGQSSGDRHFTARFSASWLLTGLVLWIGGMVLVLLSVIIGRLRLGRISRLARPLETDDWSHLLMEACQTLNFRRAVIMLKSADSTMPLTWGWWRPVILLPAEAEQWTNDRRIIVLLHELAHVKRWDCLTQLIASIVCALYWFNPIVWVAARRMRIERERACDDLVLNGGCKASDYAAHLVEIAHSFRRVPLAAAIAMARPSGLEGRVSAIVDASRTRHLRPATLLAVLVIVGGIIFSVGGCKTSVVGASALESNSLRQQQITELEAFSKAKEKQAKTLAEAEGQPIGPDYQRLFDAATRSDVNAVTNIYADFKRRHGQYAHSTEVRGRILPHTAFWSPVLEVDLAYDHVANCDPKYTQLAVHDIINSIPRGSIYFGGTDPGRGLPTAFSKSQIDADPFYTLTQNALADGSYLDYLRMTYGEQSKLLDQFIKARHADSDLRTLDVEYNKALDKLNSLYTDTNHDLKGPEIQDAEELESKLKQQIDERAKAVWAMVKEQAGTKVTGTSIYTPTWEDSQKSFQDYVDDAKRRVQHDEDFPNEPRQIKPGEDVKVDKDNGRVQVSGQIAVMSINARLTKIIFDKNPDHEFYIEESFPLDWMYPHLEPHGLIMRINRGPLSALPEDVIRKDHQYWQKLVAEMIGDWLNDETSVQTIAEFAEKVYLRKDLTGFTGDPSFVRDNYAPKMFSKWRSSIGGIYAWRLGTMSGVPTPDGYGPKTDEERQHLIREADFAYRQAFALCPYSPEAVFRYVNFLATQKRISNALLIAETASHLEPRNEALQGLVKQLKTMRQAQ